MTQISLSSALPRLKIQVRKLSLFYLGLGLLLNGSIWSGIIYYLQVTKPSYTSEWSLIMPGSAPGVNVNLPNIGQAESSSSSPFGSPSSDPRANYQYMLASEHILKAAAESMGVVAKEFGKPKIKLIDNTTIINIKINGESPEISQKKAYAIQNALNSELQRLRTEELVKRDKGMQYTLSSAKTKLERAQIRLSRYEIESDLSFPEQLKDLSVNIEQLRKQRVEVISEQKRTAQQLQQLSTSLGISPEQANEAFILQADQIFQQTLKEYSDSTVKLNSLSAKWTSSHPEIVQEKLKQNIAKNALIKRSQVLLGKTFAPQTLAYLQIGSSDSGTNRASLFRDMVATQSQNQGLTQQVQTLEQQIRLLEKRLDAFARKQSGLNNLKRDLQTAETVFASTLAKIDLGKSDIYSAYPLVQMLEAPTLPEEPTSPKTKLILAGTAAGTGMITIALFMFWFRSCFPSHNQPRKNSPLGEG
ncbi:GumC family protein [Calothrix sp. 336/3]|uniref:GumC family protein n=1 Tax=Calothrix sp. 336/3 TaxID=1337936 RepID=UPI0006245762|nr:hypothetical protein [Calothrix sp. 336/3]AKG22690.1 hypothetical protein IJ00_16680 [Calothrix sp. 336/3]